MTSKQSPTNLFRETNFEEINANLFCTCRNKKHDVIWSLFSRCMTSFVAKKQFGTGVTELLFCIERGFVASFFKLIEENDTQRQIHFCAGAWLEFKRFWSLKEKNIIVHVLKRLYLNMLKIKMRNSRNRRKFEFFIGYFWEDKIKLCIMTACMLSALRKEHVCNLKKNCNSNIFTRNCWKTTHRWSWMLLQISDGT